MTTEPVKQKKAKAPPSGTAEKINVYIVIAFYGEEPAEPGAASLIPRGHIRAKNVGVRLNYADAKALEKVARKEPYFVKSRIETHELT